MFAYEKDACQTLTTTYGTDIIDKLMKPRQSLSLNYFLHASELFHALWWIIGWLPQHRTYTVESFVCSRMIYSEDEFHKISIFAMILHRKDAQAIPLSHFQYHVQTIAHKKKKRSFKRLKLFQSYSQRGRSLMTFNILNGTQENIETNWLSIRLKTLLTCFSCLNRKRNHENCLRRKSL